MAFPSSKIVRITLVFALVLLFFFYQLPALRRLGDWPTKLTSGQNQVKQDFVPSREELACLYGMPLSDKRLSLANILLPSASRQPIPNIVHFIWLQKLPVDPAGQSDFDFVNYLAVRSALVSLEPEAVILHYGYTSKDPALQESFTADPLMDNNRWIQRLAPRIKLVRHTGPLNNSIEHSAHMADKMRLELLQEQGGVYLDMDVFALRPFTDMLKSPHPHDVVLGHEGGNRVGLCNAVIAARPNSAFVQRWLDTYDGVDLNKEWNYHSVLLPKELADRYPHEVCKLAPDAFFWPTYSRAHVSWMHEPISKAKAQFWKRRIKKIGGSLFDNQLTYHAWSTMAGEKFLRRLTPQVVRDEDTRFNLLVRRFLDKEI